MKRFKVVSWYCQIMRSLTDSYIFFYKGRNALYCDERFYNLFNFKMVSSTNFLLRRFDSDRRHKDCKKINLKRQYTIDSRKAMQSPCILKKSL